MFKVQTMKTMCYKWHQLFRICHNLKARFSCFIWNVTLVSLHTTETEWLAVLWNWRWFAVEFEKAVFLGL